MSRLQKFKTFVSEDVPTTNASSGNVAGIGVGPQGEPGGINPVMKRMMRRKRLSRLRKS